MVKASRYPWFKFFGPDWQSDPKLRMCSLAARGLWLEIVIYMEASEPKGYLHINGITPSVEQLAGLIGRPLDEVKAALDELEMMGVFSRDRHQNIYSRRILRTEKRAKTSRKNGKKGGNPSLKKNSEGSSVTSSNQREIKTQVNPQDNAWDNREIAQGVKPQIPDARSQSIESVIKNSDNTHTSSIENTSVGRFAFSGEVVKITHEDFVKWQQVYHAIPDLMAELHSRDEYLADLPPKKRGNWFMSTSTYLKNKHQQHLSDASGKPKQSVGEKIRDEKAKRADWWRDGLRYWLQNDRWPIMFGPEPGQQGYRCPEEIHNEFKPQIETALKRRETASA